MNTEQQHRNQPPVLPAPFAHLAPFIGWSLATETERNRMRNTSDMRDIIAFKDAMLADVDAIVAWLDNYPLDAMPPEAQALMHMLLSLAEVAPAVEAYHQPGVIDGYDPTRFVADENFVMRPPI
ncbi:hypothetical protein [Herbaspirillum sp. alder98]|uniref:hypothetical protein n=1 Tax=Herbaspirillum sp. alder98 TaxID=2913096 RepID=UPI001CD8F19A|nr:hypothetical protein [Herbaspirillum sp. alder98]MCA1326868.1 hypothetical protein [Herbaspirillum sp. alder98]